MAESDQRCRARWSAQRRLEPAQRCQAQLFSAMSFCHRNLGLRTWARELSANLRAHKLTQSSMQDVALGLTGREKGRRPLPRCGQAWVESVLCACVCAREHRHRGGG